MKEIRAYYVEYNCKFIAMYKTLNGALKFIERKGLKNDYDNIVRLFDNNGNEYNTLNGKGL